ncbi:complex I NDUFA9 subunit family protein [Caulobacter sp. NIBR1757]|uniref:complex I NDUFA9 subunit family protein n=1 Tax=Caulobacter sp. NIBR1757 TaxID=3016000 RepID=UPI0022F07F72|nr:complex I NDUFA9 subunit family protein [Caulobacter sp. NIBR1757]WGM41184.1 N-acetyl-alpha-D-glucosaminyl-diphospho-ditrans, octacis-undecaprenol 4-epimerase [Caulobacter sp. NIBR1757]
MQGLVTVFGGTGFIGRQVVRALAKKGLRVRAAARQPGRGYRLRMLGDVGQISVVQANIRDKASIARAVEGAEAVINLVGIMRESGRQRFLAVHGMGTRNVAEAARAAGARRFVQMSAIGADPDGASKYARTKAEGEAAVREVYPDAVIIRPSIVFGPEDDFFNRFGQMAALSPALPLIGGGHTKFQPIYVGDLAAAIAQAAASDAFAGQTIELGGPAVHDFKALMAFVCTETGRKRILAPLPFPLAALMGMAGDLVGAVIAPPITSDQVELLRTDNVATGPGLEAFGIVGKPIEAIVPSYLYRYRKGGQYAETPEGAY